MRSRMRLGDFLVSYLRRAGVEHIFGLPGDLVLGLFHRFGRERGIEIVTFSHEPTVGFAADGYARSTRRLRGARGSAGSARGTGPATSRSTATAWASRSACPRRSSTGTGAFRARAPTS